MRRATRSIAALAGVLLAGCGGLAARAERSREVVGGDRVMIVGTVEVPGDAAGVVVSVYHPASGDPWYARTDADGRFEIPRVPPGRLRIAVDPWDGGIVQRVKPLGDESTWFRWRCDRRHARFEPAGCWTVRAPAGTIVRLRITLDHLRRPQNVLWGALARPRTTALVGGINARSGPPGYPYDPRFSPP